MPNAPGEPRSTLVIEAQTQIDPQKLRVWPIYLAGSFVRYGGKVDLIVITLDREVAAWASRTIDTGAFRGGLSLTPIVIGPDQIPRITDLDDARRAPELTVLSALAHGHEPDAEPLALAAFAALSGLDNDHETLYADLVLHHLEPVARALLEKLMSTPNYQYQSDFALKFFTEGKAEGEASLLLRILERRGIAISEHDRDRVLSCTELAQIESWADRALTATTRDEVFES